jgi:K+/H+ antiporter YhaU regulatory subunit KhtT
LVVAVVRDGGVVANPTPDTVLAERDLLGVIGSPGELRALEELLGAAQSSVPSGR